MRGDRGKRGTAFPARILIALFGLVFLSIRAEARIATPRLDELVRRADLICVARVERIDTSPAGETRVATARLLDIWKGDTVAQVSFQAHPTWVCDLTDARAGEVVVLFLTGRSDEVMRIDWSGAGRMRIIERGRLRYVEGFVRWPDGLAFREDAGVRRPLLDSLKAYVHAR